MWERTLQDLIRGLRSHKHSSKSELDAFIEEALAEIRGELKGGDMELKAEGVVKMCYLMMLYPLPPPPSFAFHVVEVMSSPKYHLKQLGYIAAPLAFSSETEEVVLTINGMRKDLLSPIPSLPPLALSGLSDIITPSLAREVSHDVLSLLTHSRPQVRKRAVLAMFKVFEKYPDSLRTGFGRLKDRLSDDDPSVVSATINVITELSLKSNPRNYLPLAPQLFEILTSSTNNWMLIKVVKLFATLTPLEPRLTRKLLPPLTNLISTTPAISLLYECVRTCIVGGMLEGEVGGELGRVCVEKLGGYLGDEDQNLKYIALLALVKIVPTHPDLVAEYQDEILKSLDDADVSIRMRALELVGAMVNRRNIREIVTQLLSHLVPSTTAALPSAISSLLTSASSAPTPTPTPSPTLTPAYRLSIVHHILRLTSLDTYSNITDFQWYLSVLLDLTYVSGVDVGAEIRDTVLDVVGRVKSVRGYAVGVLGRLLADEGWLEGEGTGKEVVYAAAWVCGEYASEIHHPPSLLLSLLHPSLLSLSFSTQAVILTAITKIFSHYAASLSSSWDESKAVELKELVGKVLEGLGVFARADGGVEVQERVSEITQLFRFIQADLSAVLPPTPTPSSPSSSSPSSPLPPNYPKSLFLLPPLHTSYPLLPVGYRAQESVPLPAGLDLESWLVPGAEGEGEGGLEFPDLESDAGDGGGEGMKELRRVMKGLKGKKEKGKKGKGKVVVGSGPEGKETKEERAARKARKAARKADPYYLGGKDSEGEDIDSIPIVQLDLELDEDLPQPAPEPTKKSSRKKKVREPSPPPPEIDRTGEMPESSSSASALAAPVYAKQEIEEGLKSINLVDQEQDSLAPTGGSRFEEYRDDEDAPGSGGAEAGGGGAGGEVGRQDEGERAVENVKVEVVKVRKKKKKGGVALDA